MTATEAQVRAALQSYAAMWSENDPVRIRELVDACWRDDSILLSNIEALDGREALYERVRAYRESRPGDRARLVSGPEIHNGWFRFEAVVVREDGSEYSHALDVGEVGEDGRIVRLITFFGQAAS